MNGAGVHEEEEEEEEEEVTACRPLTHDVCVGAHVCPGSLAVIPLQQ